MENFKSILSLLIGLALLAGIGFWAFSTLESGSTHVNIQRQKDLQAKNQALEKELVTLKTQVGLLESDKVKEAVVADIPVLPVVATSLPVVVKKPITMTPNVLKYQSLITEIQKLINIKAYLKKGSQGTAVGTVQKFINIYNNTSNKIDNDYGVSLITTVSKFQKDQGLTADGQAGVGTFKKMIDWLKKK